jgi:cyanobactin maturation PatA/PatG family protease
MIVNNATDIFAIPGLNELQVETHGSPEVLIAVLDGPVDLSHPCFNGAKLTQLPTMASGEATQGLAAQHGTHVVSIIFGQHESEVRGIAPKCQGLIVPVFADEPNGGLAPCSQIDLARAITQAVEAGAHIINISGGQLAASGEADGLLENAVRLCQERQVLLVAAAGNDGCECLHVPAALESVLAVGAMNNQGMPLEMSNWGEAYQNEGLLAPGEHILGAASGGGTARRSGTSFAAPIVSGIAALLLSLQRQQGRPGPSAVRKALLRGTSPCNLSDRTEQKRCLAGRLNLPETYNLFMKKGGSQTMSEKETMISAEPEIAEDVQQDAVVGVTPSADCGCAVQNEVSTTPEQEMPDTLHEPAAVQASPAVAPSSAAAVTPSSSCGCGAGSSQLVYALGDLDVDYGSEAKRDSYLQNMDGGDLLKYLDEHPYAAQNLIWTLNLDATPIYAIVPMGAYASEAYDQLRKALASFGEGRIERVAIPGYIGGSIQLMSGQTVPTIIPEIRGMVAWTNVSICENAKCMLKEKLKASGKGSDNDPVQEPNQLDQQLDNYLNRVYYDYRNLGLTPHERALNFSATNAYQITEVLIKTGEANLVLDQIQVEKSPICRPESDCHDVKLSFFDPENNQRARRIYRFTVDVSEAVPVTIGKVRSWAQS